MLESGFLQNVLEPVPLVARVMVVAMPGLVICVQVKGGVDGHQLQLPACQVYLIVATLRNSSRKYVNWSDSLVINR